MSIYQLALYAALSLLALTRLFGFAKIAGEYTEAKNPDNSKKVHEENNPTV